MVHHTLETLAGWQDSQSRDLAKEMRALTLIIVVDAIFQADVTEETTRFAEAITVVGEVLAQRLSRDDAAQFFVSVLRDEIVQERQVDGLPAGFDFPVAITGAGNDIPIRYELALTFDGAMTGAELTILLNDAALAAVTGLPGYQQAVQSLFGQPGRRPWPS